ncbi:hypothetical protein ACJRO7_013611 [Eucalyptus globulus]|uniref:PABS domain-containing protein n=1 Tax=Eucalyptus globulus TaxID=34317 RepID=A0ABD3KYG2_EUCGL
MADKMVDQIRAMGLNNKIEWYPVTLPEWPGDKVLSHGQVLLVFQSAKHGKVAILDGQIQLTEKDGFVYQEMLTHLPLCSSRTRRRWSLSLFLFNCFRLLSFYVLLVGGGDGGILREISHHPSVGVNTLSVPKVIYGVYKQFFPEIAVGCEDPRMNVYFEDGVAFLKAIPEGTYDAIILDAFECMGATAIELANKEFLESVARALRPGGVLSAPADSFWLDNFTLEDTIAKRCQIFKGSARYTWCSFPSYSSGTNGFVLCSDDRPAVDFEKPVDPLNTENNGVAKGPPKFYDSQIHVAAFGLPSFAKKVGSAVLSSFFSCGPLFLDRRL